MSVVGLTLFNHLIICIIRCLNILCALKCLKREREIIVTKNTDKPLF